MPIDRTQVVAADNAGVTAAVSVLQHGGLVGLPTETVYGLAARATDAAAVARIFHTKGRPADHPVIVHLGAATDVTAWATDVPDYARALMALWPGPLTLVLRKRDEVNPTLTGGQDTIGLRIPSHPVALAVLHELDDAIAAPSANRFGEVSPTSAEHVFQGLSEWLQPHDLILDGGPCEVGVESTIVDCTTAQPRILRPGAISADTVSAVAGVAIGDSQGDAPRVSGSLESHYAPTAKVLLLDSITDITPDRQAALADAAVRTGVMGIGIADAPQSWRCLLDAADADDYAKHLYSALRQADAENLDVVVAVLPPAIGIGIAIRDRLMRAAAGR